MSDIKGLNFACGNVETATTAQPHRPDVALPFLSTASDLMLISALQHFQLDEFGKDLANTWRWDFRTTLQIDSSGDHECRKNCSIFLPSRPQRTIAEKTCWKDQQWLKQLPSY